MAHDNHDDHGHEHGHDHGEMSHLDAMEVRVRALQSLLVEKGYVDPKALDLIVETYETRIGPRNGARVVARAWHDRVCTLTPSPTVSQRCASRSRTCR